VPLVKLSRRKFVNPFLAGAQYAGDHTRLAASRVHASGADTHQHDPTYLLCVSTGRRASEKKRAGMGYFTLAAFKN